MLDVKEDRIRYKELLSISDSYNYEIEKIFTTTYSLDIDALIAICLILGLDEEILESDNEDIPKLQALVRLFEKIVVVCQNGTIKSPRGSEKLCTFFENIIYTVQLKKKNFHPKFWLIKYKHKTAGTIKYKMAVMSKNLTFDRSWDMQISMEGELKPNVHDQNSNIIEFLRHIKDEIKQPNANKMINELIKDLPSVEFDMSLNRFPIESCEFIEFSGKTNNKIQYIEKGLQEKLTETFIVSPFIDGEKIQNAINNTNKKVTLITRGSELGKIKNLIGEKLDVYVVNEKIRDGEENIQEENFEAQKQDIHAKMFCFKDKQNTYLYIGSANATGSAFNGNTEIMIKITIPHSGIDFLEFIKKDILRVEEIERNGKKEERHYFRKVSQEEILKAEAQTEDDFKNFVRNFFELKCWAEVKQDDNQERYDVSIYFEKFKTNFDVSIKPLLATETNGKKLNEGNVTFKKLKLEELSEFYIVEISNEEEIHERMIKIPTKNIPNLNDRISAVASNMIKDEKDFYRCLNFILSDNYLSSLLEDSYLRSSNKSQVFKKSYIPAIYEKMLQTAALKPERFKEIEYLMSLTEKKTGSRPEGFEELYNQFKEAVKK